MDEVIKNTANVIFKMVKEDLEAKDPEEFIIKRIGDILDVLLNDKEK